MARKTNASILEGRIGNVVFYQSYGKQCVRTLAQNIKNPRTPAQQLQRAKFSAVTQWLQPLRDVIRIGYVDGDNGHHFCRAVKELLTNAIVIDGNAPHISPSLALIAQGTLTPMMGGAAAKEGEALSITWEPGAKTTRSHSDDRLVWVLYDEASRNVISNVTLSPKPMRRKGICSIDLTDASSGTYHLYAFFINAKGTMASDSSYLGEVEIGIGCA